MFAASETDLGCLALAGANLDLPRRALPDLRAVEAPAKAKLVERPRTMTKKKTLLAAAVILFGLNIIISLIARPAR